MHPSSRSKNPDRVHFPTYEEKCQNPAPDAPSPRSKWPVWVLAANAVCECTPPVAFSGPIGKPEESCWMSVECAKAWFLRSPLHPSPKAEIPDFSQFSPLGHFWPSYLCRKNVTFPLRKCFGKLVLDISIWEKRTPASLSRPINNPRSLLKIT